MTLDVATFKQRLEQERTQIVGELDLVQSENNQNVNDQGSSFGVSNHPADAASEVMSRERNMAVAMDLQVDLDAINHALERIEDGTYGTCEACGQPIAIERLEARPAATLCIKDQREREQG
ncbi:MAG: hypothetical protein NVS4B8_11510 [Herpetosiphon sp.]